MAAPKRFQSGQKILTALSGLFLLPVDNGGPVHTSVTMQVGTFTLTAATPLVVADVNATADSQIIITLATPGGTVGALPVVQSKNSGVGFTVVGTASDTSIYNYIILA